MLSVRTRLVADEWICVHVAVDQSESVSVWRVRQAGGEVLLEGRIVKVQFA